MYLSLDVTFVGKAVKLWSIFFLHCTGTQVFWESILTIWFIRNKERFEGKTVDFRQGVTMIKGNTCFKFLIKGS